MNETPYKDGRPIECTEDVQRNEHLPFFFICGEAREHNIKSAEYLRGGMTSSDFEVEPVGASIPAEFIHEDGRIIGLSVMMEVTPGIKPEIFRC